MSAGYNLTLLRSGNLHPDELPYSRSVPRDRNYLHRIDRCCARSNRAINEFRLEQAVTVIRVISVGLIAKRLYLALVEHRFRLVGAASGDKVGVCKG